MSDSPLREKVRGIIAITRVRWHIYSLRLLILAAFVAITWWAIDAGIRVRHWAWDYTAAIHYYPDINNGYHWGTQGNESRGPGNQPRGVLNVYDLVAGRAERRSEESPDYQLDYAPLRLMLMTRWVRWTQDADPKTAQAAHRAAEGQGWGAAWKAPYTFFAPILRFNNVMELLAAAGIFLLARHWVRRAYAPSPGTPGEGWGEGDLELREPLDNQNHPHPNPLPEYREREPIFGPFCGCIAGLLGALLFWFSPAVIVSTHGWPTWDEWIIPFFVWAVYLACLDWWFCAGLVIGIGSLMKGQQLFIAPMFILWPIFIGRPSRAIRWLAGLVFAVAAIVSPWLLSYVPGGVTSSTVATDRILDRPAIDWIICVTLAMGVVPFLFRWEQLWGWIERATSSRWKKISHKEPDEGSFAPVADSPSAGASEVFAPPVNAWDSDVLPCESAMVSGPQSRWMCIGVRVLLPLLVIGLILWPFFYHSNRDLWPIGLALVILPLSRLIVRRGQSMWLAPFVPTTYNVFMLTALLVGASILLCGILFHGSYNWLYIGWGYGTRHYFHMTQGVSDNLAGILHERFGWNELTELVYTFDPHPLHLWPTRTILFDTPTEITIRMLLVAVYLITFLLCVIGVAVQYRRNDPRFLVAITATWLMFFAFLPQIHERYLLYAAGVGCCLTAVSLGTTLLNLFFTLLTCAMTLHVMLGHANSGWRLRSFATDISPRFGRQLLEWISASYPDAGWAVLLAAGVFLYLSLAPSPRRRRRYVGQEPATLPPGEAVSEPVEEFTTPVAGEIG